MSKGIACRKVTRPAFERGCRQRAAQGSAAVAAPAKLADPFRRRNLVPLPLPDYDHAPRYFRHAHGHRQHYVDVGSGAPVLMLHGNPSWSYYYRRAIHALKGAHRCIAPDHIGMGWSDKPPADRYDYHLKQRVDDLDALVEHLIAEHGAPRTGWTLMVHDWGGMIGMAWACRHPERVARLVILNTGAFPNPKAMKLPWTLKLARDSSLGAFLVQRFNAFARGAATFGVKRAMAPAERAALLSPYDTPAHRIATLKFVQDIPLTPADRGYDIVEQTGAQLSTFADRPAMVFWGRHDFVFDDAFLKVWREKLPNADVRVYEDAGHYVLEDAHERILPALQDFLR
jgi:pimeloyl-ACP methyl ester carboxylesterase